MRTFLTSLAVGLALTSGASAFFPGAQFQPCDNAPPLTARRVPAIEPTIVDLHDSEMAPYCKKIIAPGEHIYGCAFPSAALIFMNDSQTDAEYACTLLYEDAHLAPNNWFDPTMEALATNR